MRQKKWRGTVLFVMVLMVMGLTVGLRLYGSGLQTSAVAAATSAPQAVATSPSTPSSGATSPSDPPPSATSSAQPPAKAPSSLPAAVTKSIDGVVEQTPYGPIQVSVTFTGSKITAVKELQAPNDRNRSIEINNSAEPILVQEVLQSQSSHIDTVSGATYTSEGYAQSVQSAVDKL